MKIKSSIIHRAFIALLTTFLFLATGLYSCVKAQSALIDNHSPRASKHTKMTVRYHATVNHHAKSKPMHGDINSAYVEIKPSVCPQTNRLYFSRHSHPDNTFGIEDLEDIWFSEYNPDTKEWGHPVKMAGALNNAGPNYVQHVSITGDTLILGNQYLKKGRMRAGLSYSTKVNGEWTHPKTIHTINDYNYSNQSNSFVSIKNGVIISAIHRLQSVGDRDLFVSFWDGHKATEPINMGTVLNSDEEESSPFLAPDNVTLFFASRGHHGHGGMDIFVSKRLDDTWTNWSEPENLGPGVNGRLDEEHFTISHNGEIAFFSKQVTVHNDDIYFILMEELFGSQENEQLAEVVALGNN
jgi:OOP family OmpA-OmpF porin